MNLSPEKKSLSPNPYENPLFAKNGVQIGQILPLWAHLYFTPGYRGWPPCTMSHHPDNRETGYSKVLGTSLTAQADQFGQDTLHQVFFSEDNIEIKCLSKPETYLVFPEKTLLYQTSHVWESPPQAGRCPSEVEDIGEHHVADHSPPDPLVHPHLVVGLVHVDASLQHDGNLVRVGKLDTLLPPPCHSS